MRHILVLGKGMRQVRGSQLTPAVVIAQNGHKIRQKRLVLGHGCLDRLQLGGRPPHILQGHTADGFFGRLSVFEREHVEHDHLDVGIFCKGFFQYVIGLPHGLL